VKLPTERTERTRESAPSGPERTNPPHHSAAGQNGCEVSDERVSGFLQGVRETGILGEVAHAIAKYSILPNVDALVAVTLWTVATHLIDEFDTATRLVVRSPEKRSGKTRLVNEVLGALVAGPLPVINASPAYIYRKLAQDGALPTLLVDEVDRLFGTVNQRDNNSDLISILNAGYRRNNPVGRTTGPTHQPVEFPSFAMVALAGINQMPDTIEDRAVVIAMRRRKRSETVSAFRYKRDIPLLHVVRDRVAEWAESVREQAGQHIPADMEIDDRAADIWEPLVTVADLGGNGGKWPELARLAARRMTRQVQEDDDYTTLLLADIRSVFTSEDMSSAELLAALRLIDGSPWGEGDANLTAVKLGNKLKPYEIKARNTGERRLKRYHLEDFQDAFSRYLPPEHPGEARSSARGGGSHAL
jgi:hypothetical protein